MVKNPPTCQCRRHERCEFDPWVVKFPWRRAWQPTPVSPVLENPMDRRSLQGYSPLDHKESDKT